MINIYKSLASFQQECPVIHKGSQGYGYSYADLPEIFEVINPLLKKNGLGFTQLVNGKSIKTILFHIESGETIESETEISQNVTLKGMNEFQVLGSAITYIRRYALSSMLGIVTDKDTDVNGKPGDKKENKQESDLPWLNLFDKQGNHTKAYNALAKSISDGNKHSLKSIREKYKVSKITEEELKQLFNIQ